ncbi:DNA internalization-related competence protein ComEC/Rec2 [candidate division KSB1 bacterium]|nr:DNA internalization-related competence protein ComEC/Rec2 [candidate division KSB1 bacterium]RQV99879.1 MAG: DNA internalization-related competence protein ComEC/Rec2 [candidate division KSB1 bacterium]
MRWLVNKPAMTALLPFMAGLILSFYCDFPVVPLCLLLVLLLVGSLVFQVKSKGSSIAILFLLFFAGLLRLELKMGVETANHIVKFCDLPHIVSVEGVICRPVEMHGEMQRTVLAVDSVWILHRVYPAHGSCLLQLYAPRHDLKYGDRIVARGQLRSPAGERNPGDFNYRRYLAAQNIFAIFRLYSAKHIVLVKEGEGNPIFRHILLPVRHFILQVIDSSLSGQPAALLKALLIGARGELDENIRQSFVNVGVIHVLAVSGLHVGFVLAGLLGFFRFVRLPTLWRILLTCLCLIFYAFITGLKPSIIRATIMAIVYLFGVLLQRRSHLLNTLSIAAFIILFIAPLSLFEAGFQLSFVAVLGIVLIYELINRLLRPVLMPMQERGWLVVMGIIKLFVVSVAAQIATLPLTVYYFNRVSLLSFFANLVVVPTVALIVALGMVAVFISVFSASIGALYLNVVWLLLSGLITFVKTVQTVPLAYVTMPRPSLLLISLYFMSLLLFVGWPHPKVRKIFIFAFILLLNSHIWLNLKNEKILKVTFFDVGQGDATLFELPRGKTVLVDAGDCTQYVDCGERIISPYLLRNGITKIDQLILTHAHSDHIGGALYLLENIRVGRLVKTHLQTDSEIDRSIEELAIRKNIPIRYVQAGDTLLVDIDVLVLIMHPTPSYVQGALNSSELNNSSLVFKCIYYTHTILMTGDAEKAAESSILSYGSLLQSTILKLAHHGSSTASSESFRRALKAKYGIVSVAKWNRFDLPSKGLLTKFENEKTHILTTSEHGAVQFVFYPDRYVRSR